MHSKMAGPASAVHLGSEGQNEPDYGNHSAVSGLAGPQPRTCLSLGREQSKRAIRQQQGDFSERQGCNMDPAEKGTESKGRLLYDVHQRHRRQIDFLRLRLDRLQVVVLSFLTSWTSLLVLHDETDRSMSVPWKLDSCIGPLNADAVPRSA